MKIDFATLPKPRANQGNEDIAGYMDDTYWLMDGATQLVPTAFDAQWHVRKLDEAFRQTLRIAPQSGLKPLTKKAIDSVSKEFYRVSGIAKDAPRDYLPFSNLVLCRLNPARTALDYLLICDSTLAVITPDSEIVESDTRIDDGHFLDRTDQALRDGHGFNSDVFRGEMRAAYDISQRVINQPGGFDVVGQDSRVVDRSLTGRIPLPPGSTVLLMSDGFTRAVDTLGIYNSFRELNTAVAEKGGDVVLQEIRAAEATDNTGKCYPRSSVHDDKTCLRLCL